MSIRIQVQPPDSEPRVLEFDETTVTIGRGADNHIVIEDARSSRKHASVSKTAHGVVLEDLGSSNGTKRDGEAITRALITSGDKFSIGKTEFCYDPDENVSTASAASDSSGGLEESGGVGDGSSGEELELETSSSPVVATASTVVARLRNIEGSLEDSVVEIASLPFVIGRGKEVDLALDDRRVSTRHAEILRKKDMLVLKDLGSRNGCAVDSKRVSKGAVLGQGSKLAVGEHLFEVELADPVVIQATLARDASRKAKSSGSSKSASRATSTSPASGGESSPEAGRLSVDVESLLKSEQLGQTVSTVILVVIVLGVAWFSYDLANRLLSKEAVDPPVPSNVVENWSFEARPENEDSSEVPGWELSEGSRGEIAVTAAEARDPGNWALQITAGRPSAEDGSDLACSVEQERTFAVPIDRRYLLEGFVANQSAFAAGISIDWYRGKQGSGTLVGRSYSATAKGRGDSIDVSQIVQAPGGASYGVLSCFAFGPGSAIFDQISLSSLAESDGDGDGTTETSEGEVADAPVEEKSEFEFRVTTEDEPLLGGLREGGILSIRRGSRSLIPYLWGGVDLERDPLALGPRLSEMRIRSGEGGRVIANTEIPDLEARKFASLETSIGADPGAISIRWRLESGDSEGSRNARALVLQLQTTDGSLSVVAHGDAAAGGSGRRAAFENMSGGPFVELVFGEQNRRTSFEFSTAVEVRTVGHPVLAGRSLMLVEPADGSNEIELTVTHGSRREAQAARIVLTEAERLFGEGRDREALTLLEELDEKYPLQEAEIASAAARVEQWNAAAKEVEQDLDVSIEAYRANPSKVVFNSLVSRIEQLADRYSGTGQESVMKRKGDALRASRAAAGESIRRSKAQELVQKARDAMRAQQLGLADLYVRLLLDTWKENDSIRTTAERLRTQIAGRRKTATEVLLGN